MGRLTGWFKDEPVQTIVTGLFALVQAFIGLCLSFGAHLTVNQVMSIDTFVVALLAFIARGKVSPADLANTVDLAKVGKGL